MPVGAPPADAVTADRAGALAALLVLLVVGGLGAQAPTEGTFVLTERVLLGEANAGTMYRYRRPDGVGVDLFITPLPPSLDPCTGLCASRAVQVLSEQLTAAIILDREQGAVDSVRRAGALDLAPPAGSWLEHGRLTALRAYRGDQHTDSYVWLFAGQETLVQVRGAEPAGAIDFATLAAFVNTLLEAVPPTYDCPNGLNTDPADVILQPIDIAVHRLPFRVDSTLTALGYRFVYQNRSTGLWRTAPRYTWPTGSSLQAWAAGIHPGIELVVVTEIGTQHSVVGISARPVCRSSPASLRADAAAAALAHRSARFVLDAILDAVGYLR